VEAKISETLKGRLTNQKEESELDPIGNREPMKVKQDHSQNLASYRTPSKTK
jgi:hypothetical protein